jgi:DNA-binding transcriptional MerR regulator
MQNLTIGAVAKLTQIPPHTLRKWESRHGIATPDRTDTGRRVYSQAHVEQLRLIKELVSAGHALGHLADLNVDELRELLGLHHEPEKQTRVTRVHLVGPNVARLLPDYGVRATRFMGDGTQWLKQPVHEFSEDEIALVIECSTLPVDTVDELTALAQKVAKVVVVFTFARRATLTRLHQAGIAAIAGPVSDTDLAMLIDVESTADVGSTSREHRFSAEELARIAALSPGIACECPNHIAKLLMDITAFEQYSRECTDTDPQERALHEQLGRISASARALFEDALVQVALVDGLSINTNESTNN